MKIENPNQLIQLLSKAKLSLENEKVTQSQLSIFLTNYNIKFEKEFQLDNKNIIDFYFPSILTGVEIKINTSTKKSIYKQMVRYCEFEQINHIILLTNKSMGLPEVVNNKKTFVINLGKAWI